MARLILAVFLSLMTVQVPALAQITELKGKYIEGNIIRVFARVKMPSPPGAAYQVAMLKAATMAGQKGFSRLAVIMVDDCVYISVGINSLPVVQTCKVFGKMLSAGEIAEPKGKGPVKYYSLTRIDNGTYLPTLEQENKSDQSSDQP